MRQLFIILFSLTILVQTCQLTFMYSYYQWNMDYITEKFCVNKDDLQKSCYGKCHINKVAKESIDTDSEEKTPISIKEYNSPVIFLEVLEKLNEKTTVTSNVLNSTYLFSYAFFLTHSIFHPPKF
jgi:hypothetical protein